MVALACMQALCLPRDKQALPTSMEDCFQGMVQEMGRVLLFNFSVYYLYIFGFGPVVCVITVGSPFVFSGYSQCGRPRGEDADLAQVLSDGPEAEGLGDQQAWGGRQLPGGGQQGP